MEKTRREEIARFEAHYINVDIFALNCDKRPIQLFFLNQLKCVIVELCILQPRLDRD